MADVTVSPRRLEEAMVQRQQADRELSATTSAVAADTIEGETRRLEYLDASLSGD